MKLLISIISILFLLGILLPGVQGGAYNSKSLEKPVRENVRRIRPSNKRSRYSYKRKISRKQGLKKRRAKRHRRFRKKYRKRHMKRRSKYRHRKGKYNRYQLRKRRSKRYIARKRRARRYQLGKRRSKRYMTRKRHVKKYRLGKGRSKRYMTRKRHVKKYRLGKGRSKRRLQRKVKQIISQDPIRKHYQSKRRDKLTKYRAKIHRVNIQKVLGRGLSKNNLQDYGEKLSTLEFDIYIEDKSIQETADKKVKKPIVPIRQKANLSFLKGFFEKVSFDDSSYDNDLLEKDRQLTR